MDDNNGTSQAEFSRDNELNGHDRILRGGCWNFSARDSRSACWGWFFPSGRTERHGFRIALVQKIRKDAAQLQKNNPKLLSNKDLLYSLRWDADDVTSLSEVNKDRTQQFVTDKVYLPPFTIDAEALLSGSGHNVRFQLCHGVIIFNWECNHNDLRLDLPGITSRKNGVANGRVPCDTWVSYKIVVKPHTVSIYVDGHLLHKAHGNFKSGPIGMHTCFGGRLKIKKFSVTQRNVSQTFLPKTQQKDARKILINGIFDGKGFFRFSLNRITYHHQAFDMPKQVTVNGQAWENLKFPFLLQTRYDFSQASVKLIRGRGKAYGIRNHSDFIVTVNDPQFGAADYQIGILGISAVR